MIMSKTDPCLQEDAIVHLGPKGRDEMSGICTRFKDVMFEPCTEEWMKVQPVQKYRRNILVGGKSKAPEALKDVK